MKDKAKLYSEYSDMIKSDKRKKNVNIWTVES